MICMMTGCGNTVEEKSPAEPEKVSDAPAIADKKILVVYFSRTGEEYNVGTITKGNTAIIAEMIAQKTGADTFEVKAATPYPDEYDACTELAKKELESNARPAFASNVENLAQYDTVFIGFPIWWGAVPRVMMTFLESNDFSGKTIIPFCTHGGSGLAGTRFRDAPRRMILPPRKKMLMLGLKIWAIKKFFSMIYSPRKLFVESNFF